MLNGPAQPPAVELRQILHYQVLPFNHSLAEKRGENPNVDLLVGAVNIWNWDADPVQMATQLRAAGIERILWSRGGSANALRALNDMKVLTSRYDIYQDTINVEWSRMLS